MQRLQIFKVTIDEEGLRKDEIEFDLEIKGTDALTAEEFKQLQYHIQQASQLTLTGMQRMVKKMDNPVYTIQ